MRPRGTLLLMISLACGPRPPDGGDSGEGPLLLQYPALEAELEAYANGRSAELAALQRAASPAAIGKQLDSIGGAASGLTAERYAVLAGDVEAALKAWRQRGIGARRARQLDSLRVERLVLLARAERPP